MDDYLNLFPEMISFAVLLNTQPNLTQPISKPAFYLRDSSHKTPEEVFLV